MSKSDFHFVRRGSGTPILFLHGNGVDHRMMFDLDDAFINVDKNGRDVQWERIYIDLPGFGQTKTLEGAGGLPEIADWVNQAVEELIGSSPFAVVGTSLGGLLARDLVARRKEQTLGFALLDPVVDSIPANRQLPEKSVLVADKELIDSLDPQDSEMYVECAVRQSKENWERFRDIILPGLRIADDKAVEKLIQNYALAKLPDEALVGYDRPVLIVVGRQDSIVGFEDQWALSGNFPRCTYAVLDGAGHNLQIDQPETVHALLRQWANALQEI